MKTIKFIGIIATVVFAMVTFAAHQDYKNDERTKFIELVHDEQTHFENVLRPYLVDNLYLQNNIRQRLIGIDAALKAQGFKGETGDIQVKLYKLPTWHASYGLAGYAMKFHKEGVLLYIAVDQYNKMDWIYQQDLLTHELLHDGYNVKHNHDTYVYDHKPYGVDNMIMYPSISRINFYEIEKKRTKKYTTMNMGNGRIITTKQYMKEKAIEMWKNRVKVLSPNKLEVPTTFTFIEFIKENLQ